MYLGAIKAWADEANPERLCHAAHSLRELMANIGPFLDVPALNPEVKKGQGRLNDKFDKVVLLLAAAKKNRETGTLMDGQEKSINPQLTCF